MKKKTLKIYFIRRNFHFVRMMRMHEHGLQGRENARMYTKKPRCIGHAGNFITASLVDTKPALLILLWGFAFSATVLFIELIFIHYSKKWEKRKIKQTEID